jgi:hypothetical protein
LLNLALIRHRRRNVILTHRLKFASGIKTAALAPVHPPSLLI